MKNLHKILIFTLILLLGGSLLFAEENEHGRDIDSIINDILQIQNINDIKDIQPENVEPKLMEELGDSVMGVMIDNERRHEWMDNMMGGEGSDQLASIHRSIGYQYLLNDGKISSRGWGMMGPGMMGGWNDSRNWAGDMMGYWSFWSWAMGLVAILVIILILFLVIRKPHSRSSTPLDILKSRYVNGEINEEEYLSKKEFLKGSK